MHFPDASQMVTASAILDNWPESRQISITQTHSYCISQMGKVSIVFECISRLNGQKAFTKIVRGN